MEMTRARRQLKKNADPSPNANVTSALRNTPNLCPAACERTQQKTYSFFHISVSQCPKVHPDVYFAYGFH